MRSDSGHLGKLARRGGLWLAITLCFAFIRDHAHGDEGTVPDPNAGAPLATAVTPPAEPVRVQLGAYLVQLSDVDPPSKASPSYKAEIFLDLKWEDPRLAFSEAQGGARRVYQDAAAEAELQRLWSPNIHIVNEQGIRRVDARTLTISASGTVEYTERFEATLHASVDLRRFPFDEQRFDVEIESFNWDEGSVVFEPYAARTGFDEHVHTLEWHVLGTSARVSSKGEVRSDRKFSNYRFEIHLERASGYYLWKLVLPLLMIVAFSWSTFWMTGEAASTRMQRSFVAMLTLVAFYQVVSANLPRISYLTFMDGVAFLAFFSVALTILQVILLQRASQRGEPARVERLDRRARLFIPGGFCAGFLVLWLVFHG
jgi:hypothetical protein